MKILINCLILSCMAPELPDISYGVIVLNTADAASRDRVKARIEAFAAQGGLPEARVRVTTLFLGPPVGYPVQFRVIGPEPNRVRQIAYQVRDIMRANPNTADVNLDWNEQARAIRLVVDQDRARILGLTPQDIAEALQALLSGVTITQVRDGIELVNVVARAVPEERLRPEALADLTISIRNGKIIPLSQVARLEYVYEEPILWRQSRDLTITVRSEVKKGVQAPDVTMASITGIVGYIGIDKMGRINDLADEMYAKELLGISYIKEANIDLVYIDRATKNLLLASTASDRTKYIDLINKYKQEYQTQLDKAKPLFYTDKGKELLGKLSRAWEDYQPVLSRLVEIAKQEDLAAKRESVDLSMSAARCTSKSMMTEEG